MWQFGGGRERLRAPGPSVPMDAARILSAARRVTWCAVRSDDGDVYFMNETTRQTQWEKPSGVDEADIPFFGDQRPGAITGAEKGAGGQGDDLWWAVQDADGDTYYQHDRTKQTQWNRPVQSTSPHAGRGWAPRSRSATRARSRSRSSRRSPASAPRS